MERGTFRTEVLLTGSLEAEVADVLSVPKLPEWRVNLKWLAEDGIVVKKGDKVAELDTSQFVQPLLENTLAASSAAHELSRLESETQALIIGNWIELQQRRVEEEKARLDADTAPELVSEWEALERELAWHRARIERVKSSGQLEANEVGAESDRAVQELEYEMAESRIEESQEAIDNLTFRAPRDGVLIIADHPWTKQKLKEGESLWIGRPVASIPDLSTLRVMAQLPDVDEGDVGVGQRVEAVLDSFPDEVYEGEVVNVGEVATEAARNSLIRHFPVTIALDSVDPDKMLPGQSVKVRVLGEERAGVLLVPRGALDPLGEVARLQRADGTVVEVTLGSCNATTCVVEAGVEEGTAVAVWGTIS